MRSFKSYFLLVFLLSILQSQAQEFEPHPFVEEYQFHPMEHKAIFENANVPIEILDTIIENEIFLAQVTFSPRERHQCLIKKQGQHWICCTISKQFSTVTYELVDFDSIPGKEIHITYTRSSGRSGWSGGFSEYTTGEMLVNLDNFTCYYSIFYMNCLLSWSNLLEDDDPDTTEQIEIIDSYLDALEGLDIRLKIEPGRLLAWQVLSDCGSDLKDYEGPEEVSPKVYEYGIREGKLVLKP